MTALDTNTDVSGDDTDILDGFSRASAENNTADHQCFRDQIGSIEGIYHHVMEAPIPFSALVVGYILIWSYSGSSFETALAYCPDSWFSNKSPDSGFVVGLVRPLTLEYPSPVCKESENLRPAGTR